jgi:hypothetical protein
MPVIACKLPHGLTIRHNDARVTLLGANYGEALANPSLNGTPNNNERRFNGFGLTDLSTTQLEVFTSFKNAVTFKNGKPADGKLRNPSPLFENGIILGPFKSVEEARQEINTIGSSITTGTEGLDPVKEKVEKAEF